MSGLFDSDIDALIDAGTDDLACDDDATMRKAEARLNNYIQRKAMELKIREVHQDLQVGPNERNGYTAITKATIVLDDDREFTKVHCICGAKRGINDPERLAFESSARSTIKAIEAIESLTPSPKVVDIVPVASRHFPASVPQQKKEYKHRRDRKISEKQIETIRSMSIQRRRNPDDMANQICDKNLQQLNSAEANEVIQALLKKRYK